MNHRIVSSLRHLSHIASGIVLALLAAAVEAQTPVAEPSGGFDCSANSANKNCRRLAGIRMPERRHPVMKNPDVGGRIPITRTWIPEQDTPVEAVSYECDSAKVSVMHLGFRTGSWKFQGGEDTPVFRREIGASPEAPALEPGTHGVVFSASSGLIHTVFRQEFPAYLIRRMERLDVIGHTDLQAVTGDRADFDYPNADRGVCRESGFDHRSNACLGFARANHVKDYMTSHLERSMGSGWFETVKDRFAVPRYDRDFFLRGIDRELGGTLIEALELEADIEQLKGYLQLDESRGVGYWRDNRAVRDRIGNGEPGGIDYDSRFSPFRAVVVIGWYKSGEGNPQAVSCGRAMP